MDAIELTGTTAGGKSVSVWACGVCMLARLNRDVAAGCCVPPQCECGALAAKYSTCCDECVQRKRAEREQARYDSAPKVALADYKHKLVRLDGADDATHVDDWVRAGEHAWAWAVSDDVVPLIGAVDVLEDALGDHHEEAIHDLDVGALQIAIDSWRDAQSVSWWREDGRIVLLSDKEG